MSGWEVDYDFWRRITEAILAIAGLVVLWRQFRAARLLRRADQEERKPAHDPEIVESWRVDAGTYKSYAGLKHPFILGFLLVVTAIRIVLIFAP